jgi:AraC-like DNA-binding protein
MGILSMYNFSLRAIFSRPVVYGIKTSEKSTLKSAQIQEFRTRINFHLEQKHSNCEYNVTCLSRDMGMSRSQLFRKCKLTLGKSPVALLKQYRLEKAKKYLTSGIYNVSEAAYLSGFNSLSYFSKSFKKQYRQMPSRWVE